MRMRNGNTGDASQLLDLVDAGIVYQADAVPKHVPLGRLDEKGTLTNPEPGLRMDRVDIPLLFLELVLVFAPHLLERGPFLAGPANVLPLIFTNGAMIRRTGC